MDTEVPVTPLAQWISPGALFLSRECLCVAPPPNPYIPRHPNQPRLKLASVFVFNTVMNEKERDIDVTHFNNGYHYLLVVSLTTLEKGIQRPGIP